MITYTGLNFQTVRGMEAAISTWSMDDFKRLAATFHEHTLNKGLRTRYRAEMRTVVPGRNYMRHSFETAGLAMRDHLHKRFDELIASGDGDSWEETIDPAMTMLTLTAQAVAAKDFIGDDFTQEAYDFLTSGWRAIAGEI